MKWNWAIFWWDYGWGDGDDEIYLWIVKFLFMSGKTATFEMERCLFMDG